jgi:hypothetical protein
LFTLPRRLRSGGTDDEFTVYKDALVITLHDLGIRRDHECCGMLCASKPGVAYVNSKTGAVLWSAFDENTGWGGGNPPTTRQNVRPAGDGGRGSSGQEMSALCTALT